MSLGGFLKLGRKGFQESQGRLESCAKNPERLNGRAKRKKMEEKSRSSLSNV